MSEHPPSTDPDAASPATAASGPGDSVATQDGATRAEEAPASRLEKAHRFYGLFEDVLTPQRLGLLLAGVLLLTVGWFGGMDAVTEESEAAPVVQVTAKQQFDAHPFTITPGKALETTAFKPLAYEQAGVRYVVMGLTVTSRHDAPVPASVLKDQLAVDLPELAEAQPAIYRQVDSQIPRSLQPGVTVPLALVWTQKDTAPAPTSVTLTLRSQTWRQSRLEAGYGWFDPTDVVQLKLAVRHEEPVK